MLEWLGCTGLGAKGWEGARDRDSRSPRMDPSGASAKPWGGRVILNAVSKERNVMQLGARVNMLILLSWFVVIFFFFFTRDKESDRRELEVASNSLLYFAILVVSLSFSLRSQENVSVYVAKHRELLQMTCLRKSLKYQEQQTPQGRSAFLWSLQLI